ncbi:hypothetical protein FBU59_004900 [Linderina macrospora]|uniref:Uncharacterized protein n=1 Tax=Linderina macrospora TaxID=4868 RepID=A0ACC1J4G9_9FUNG|nr:hypothetical protein FBU59_004900 [Linderina macrospora]
MGAAAGIAVLFVPPLHRALLTKGTFAYSFWYSTNLCSIACIPMVMIALGGQLALTRSQQPPTLPVSSGALIESGEEDSAVDSEVVTPHKQSQGTLLVVLGRYIIVPPITCLAMFLMMKMASGYFPLISNDPILFLTIAITSVTPPAVSLLTIAQNIGMYEDESARLLFHSYVIGVVAMAVEITIFLWLTSIIF